MGAISFDGTLPVCSWAYVNIRGWKGAFLKSFLCLNMWVGFCVCLSVYCRICQVHLKVTEKEKKPNKDLKTLVPCSCVFYPHGLLCVCLVSMTAWCEPADCNLLSVKSSFSVSFTVVCKTTVCKVQFKLRSKLTDSRHAAMVWCIFTHRVLPQLLKGRFTFC